MGKDGLEGLARTDGRSFLGEPGFQLLSFTPDFHCLQTARAGGDSMRVEFKPARQLLGKTVSRRLTLIWEMQ